MSLQISPIPAHPRGEGFSALVLSAGDSLLPVMAVDAVGRRFQVEWDPQAPVTPLGQLVFFCQFLAAGGLYSKRVADCPLRCSSPNAPSLKDLLGAWVLASLSGAWRYAHVTALRGDRVNPQGLGMEKVASEDSLRRAFQDQDGTELVAWQTEALRRTHAPALEQPWIADLDVTVKPICGHQEGRSWDMHAVDPPRQERRPDHPAPGQPACGSQPYPKRFEQAELFLSGLINAAEQLKPEERWRRFGAASWSPAVFPQLPGWPPGG